MKEISVVLICRNEENVIKRCLDSLKGIKDIVVLDTGSTDNSVNIAKSYGCNVIEAGDKFCYSPAQEDIDNYIKLFGFEPSFKLDKKYFHFADARNYALSFAKNDWCFQPDADEVVEWDIEKVKEILENEDQLVYRFVFAWKEDGTPALEFTHCKFFDKTKIHWTKWVHEVPHPIEGQNPKPPKYVDFIYHKHYQEYKESRSNYLPALELSVVRDPDDERNLFYLGREYYFQGEWQKAIWFFRRAIPKISWEPERGQAYIYVGDCYKQFGNMQNAKAAYLEGLKHCDTRREPWFALGQLLIDITPDEAIKYYLGALGVEFSHGKHGYFNDMTLYGWQIPERLSACYGRIGKFEKSKEWWKEAMKYDPPQYVKNAIVLFEPHTLPKISILIPTLRPDGLERVKRSIEQLNYPKELIEVIIGEDNPRIGVPKKVKELYEKSAGDYIIYASDDMEFYPDSVIVAVLENKDLVSFNAGELYPDKGNICEHFMIKSEFVKNHLNGEIFDTDFHHCGVDNLLWAKVNKYGTAKRCEEAKIIHNHFSKTGIMDEIYKLAYCKIEEDRELLIKKLLTI